MSKRLTQQQLDDMWAAWQEKQSVNHIVKKCKIHFQTAKKYRESERWDERFAVIHQKAIVKADAKIVTKRVSSIEMVDTAIDMWAAQAKGSMIVDCPHCGLQHEIPVPSMKAQFRDLAPFIVMKEQLGGGMPIEPRKHIVVLVEASGEYVDENAD